MSAAVQKEDVSSNQETEAQKLMKKRAITGLLLHTFQGVCQHVVCLQTEPMLMTKVCGGDVAAASRILGATSGAVGILGLLINGAGARLAESFGRKPFMLVRVFNDPFFPCT